MVNVHCQFKGEDGFTVNVSSLARTLMAGDACVSGSGQASDDCGGTPLCKDARIIVVNLP